MESNNTEGVDGTYEERQKWWEEERNIFHGRANSFIARMRLVQGMGAIFIANDLYANYNLQLHFCIFYYSAKVCTCIFKLLVS